LRLCVKAFVVVIAVAFLSVIPAGNPRSRIGDILELSTMGRNLYILAATIGILALISFALSFTNVAQVPGSPGDVRLWRTTSIALVFVGLVVALGGVLSQLFEQAERRATEERETRRHRRRRP
jgi:hypothetical protein